MGWDASDEFFFFFSRLSFFSKFWGEGNETSEGTEAGEKVYVSGSGGGRSEGCSASPESGRSLPLDRLLDITL